MNRSLPCRPQSFSRVWMKLRGRIVPKGYIGSATDEHTRRVVELEAELGDRVANVFRPPIIRTVCVRVDRFGTIDRTEVTPTQGVLL